jgi:hypothetical protein
MFKTIKPYNNVNIFRIVSENIDMLTPISLHNNYLSKYALILAYYPMKQSRYNIFIKLDKNQKVGMLNRHILGVARKLGVYQSIIKNIVKLRETLVRYKKYKNDNKKDDFWRKTTYTENELTTHMNLLLDIILEEIGRRGNTKYIRRKKLQELEKNFGE